MSGIKVQMTPSGAPASENGEPILASLVSAALRLRERRGGDVADLPIVAIAREAGISRSTMLRRLGGSRATLDEAVRAIGVDPGGRAPVRIRALDAAAEIIGESGLAAATLEAVGARADCSVHSLYAAFGGRDDLVRLVFERHGPVPDFEDVLAGAEDEDLLATVRGILDALAGALTRRPRVAPAMIAEVFARPESPAVLGLTEHSVPRMLTVLGDWLGSRVRAGAVLDLPVPLLVQQLVAPMAVHVLSRPAHEALSRDVDVDQAVEFFAAAFVRAVRTPAPTSGEKP